MEHSHRFVIDKQNIATCPCGEIRQFPWEKGGQVIVLKKGHPSISRVLKKEEHMHHKHHQIQERHRYYEANKEAIIADLLTKGRTATRNKWNIASSSLHSLMTRWLTDEQKLKIPITSPTSSPTPGETPHPSTTSTPSNGRLPPFPPFSDTWQPEVQLQWLEVYSELAKRETTLATAP